MARVRMTIQAVLAVWLGFLSSTAAGQDEAKTAAGAQERPWISVTGRGEISAKPDLVEIHVGVLTHAPSATQAAKDNGAIVTRLMATLTEHGIAEKDIQTADLRVTPRYSQPNPRQGEQNGEFVPRIIGYEVVNNVRIVLRKLDQAATLLDAALKAGANQVSGIAFRVEHPEKLLDEARKRAMADAKKKAMLLAGEAGVRLGPPRSIAEADSQPGPSPYRYRLDVGFAAAPQMPVATGEEKLSVTVSVVYGLLLPN